MTGLRFCVELLKSKSAYNFHCGIKFNIIHCVINKNNTNKQDFSDTNSKFGHYDYCARC